MCHPNRTQTNMSETRAAGPESLECRTDALRAIERLLDERPETIDAALIAATRCLVRYRGEMIGRLRENAADVHASRELTQANGALSLIFGTHYPVSGLQWERLKKVRDALKELIDGQTRY